LVLQRRWFVAAAVAVVLVLAIVPPVVQAFTWEPSATAHEHISRRGSVFLVAPFSTFAADAIVALLGAVLVARCLDRTG
jgi:hypothetical protein